MGQQNVQDVQDKGFSDILFLSRTGNLNANTFEVVADIKQACRLRVLEFSANLSSNMIIALSTYLKDGTLSELEFTDASGNTLYEFGQDVVNSCKPQLFNSVIYNDTNKTYKFVLTDDVEFPYGCKVVVHNNNATNQNAAVVVIADIY